MSQISASLVKDLRERTGLGIMECKKALQESGGDIEAAIEHLRKTSAIKAAKKASRTANEGSISVAVSADETQLVMLEVNCETDFVANDENFKNFIANTVKGLLEKFDQNENDLLANDFEVARQELIQKIGENITCSAVVKLQANAGGKVTYYAHSNNKIVAAVVYEGDDKDSAYAVAMQAVAMSPDYLIPSDATADFIAKERDIYKEEMQKSGKPADMIDKIVESKIQKVISENSLMKQNFIRDSSVTVENFCKQKSINITQFKRLAVGQNSSNQEETEE